MDRVYLCATGRYDSESLTSYPQIEEASNELSSLLKSPQFKIADEVHQIVNHKSRSISHDFGKIFTQASPQDRLLIYYVGHGFEHPKSRFVLSGTDTELVNKNGLLVPKHIVTGKKFLQLIMQSRASHIGIILDCCHSAIFSHTVETWVHEGLLIDQFLEANNRSLTLLTSGHDDNRNFMDLKLPTFTKKIMQMMRDGSAGNEKSQVNLNDLYTRLEQTSLPQKSDLKIQLVQLGMRSSFSIAKNPNRARRIDTEVIKDLYSSDIRKQSKSLDQLEKIIRFGAQEFSSRANNELQTFLEQRPNCTVYVKNRIQLLLSHSTGQQNKSGSGPNCLIVYNTRNWHFANQLQAKMTRNTICDSYDLDLAENFKFGNIDFFKSVEAEPEIILLVDQELIDTLPLRYVKIHDVLCDEFATKKLKIEIVKLSSELEINGSCFQKFKEFHPNQFDLIDTNYGLKENPNAGITSLDRTNWLMNSCLAQHEKSLKKKTKNSDLASLTLPAREPNFLIFLRNDELILVICDKDSSVDERTLQLTHETSVKSSLASKKILESLGYVDGKIDPMFTDPQGVFSRIIIDANIYFQYLMFPHSKVLIPDYLDGKASQSKWSISSFVRSLLQIHGTNRVVFANVLKSKKFDDVILKELLREKHVFTRFAPTPSNSLHLGSARTAIISYLFSLVQARESRFHIRFDNTNPIHQKGNDNQDRIRDDLEWLGVTSNVSFSQSENQAQVVYQEALDLLIQSGSAIRQSDDSYVLSTEKREGFMAYWLDLRKGPQIIHRMPTTSSRGDKLDYSLTWPKSQNFKYKFAGVVDDFMLNSLVVRDARQEDSLFTARQSVILQALREAISYPVTHEQKKLAKGFKNRPSKPKQIRPNTFSSSSQFSPFPFLCPPLYFHISRVCDQDGTILSKRAGHEFFMIEKMRQEHTFLPETILIWCLLSLGEKFRRHLGLDQPVTLIDAVVKCGSSRFLSLLRNRFDVFALTSIERGKDIRAFGLRSLDRQVLRATPTWRFANIFMGVVSNQLFTNQTSLRDFMKRLWLNRDCFSGAEEVHKFLSGDFLRGNTTISSSGGKFYGEPPRRPEGVEAWVAELIPDECKRLREILMGTRDGPEISKLIRIIGHETFVKEIHRRISYDSR